MALARSRVKSLSLALCVLLFVSAGRSAAVAGRHFLGGCLFLIALWLAIRIGKS